jgi:lysozyme family protein
MSEAFTDAVNRVLDIEAGYSNDPVDRGGETICGIARNYWSDWAGWDIVDRMKEKGLEPVVTTQLTSLATDLYRVHFWNRLRCEDLGSGTLAFELFEMAVNMSVHKAATVLQEALNLLNRDGKSWPEILEDGAVGPKTLKVLGMLLNERRGEHNIVKLVNALQAEHYIKLARRSPTQERFLRGWLDRA